MIQIVDSTGLDLVANSPSTQSISIPDVRAKANVSVSCSLLEPDDLLFGSLSGTVYWDDGSQPVVYNGAGTIALSLSRRLGPGNYQVRVEASNYVLPVPERMSVNFPVVVAVASGNVSQNIVYGPILPKDTGTPNARQWNFTVGSDLEILASSVKMLLTTAKGERVMLPDYGTNLRTMLFEFNNVGIQSMVQQEIIDALAKWEPRVALQSVSVEKTADREITVNADFVSKLNQQPFSLVMTFQ